MDYITGIVHRVENLDLTCSIFTQVLDFSIVEEGSDCVELSNGALTVYLEPAPSNSPPLVLAMQADDINQGYEKLAQAGFIPCEKGSVRNDEQDIIYLQGPGAVDVRLYHIYSEDERGILPDLPTSLEWTEQAEFITKRLLTRVPLGFRESARVKIVQQAEADAIVEGCVTVELAHACQAMFKTTPYFKHDALKDELVECQIDLSTLDLPGTTNHE